MARPPGLCRSIKASLILARSCSFLSRRLTTSHSLSHRSALITSCRKNSPFYSDASECAPEMSKEERASIICIRQNCFLTSFERRVRLAMLGSVCSVERGTVDLGKVRLPEVKRIEGVARMRRAIGFDEARGDSLRCRPPASWGSLNVNQFSHDVFRLVLPPETSPASQRRRAMASHFDIPRKILRPARFA